MVLLLYQTYVNVRKDAVCHATSTDGINFVRDSSNPIFAPTGDWTCGRAIDAEVCFFRGKYFLYFATRDPDFKVQQVGVATAPAAQTSAEANGRRWPTAPYWLRNCPGSASASKLPR